MSAPFSRRFRPPFSRNRIASTAARLMAQDGIADIALAKKKAARQLGLPDGAPLPDDAAVEAELRLYHALYQPQEQAEQLTRLRREALRLMRELAPFCPYLTGSVLEGAIAACAPIEMMLFADSAKEVEIFLLNRGMDFVALTARHDKAEAALHLSTPVADVTLIVFPAHLERHRFYRHDGRPRIRANAAQLQNLLAESGSGLAPADDGLAKIEREGETLRIPAEES